MPKIPPATQANLANHRTTDFTQSHDYKDFDETSATSLWHTGQLTWRKLTDTLNVFFTKTTTTLTYFDETFTDLLKLTLLTVRNPTPATIVAIPYIKCTVWDHLTDPTALQHSCSPETSTTLQYLLTNVKERDEPNNRQGAVYKIKWSDCQTSYIG